jgi:hypothetical protein
MKFSDVPMGATFFDPLSGDFFMKSGDYTAARHSDTDESNLPTGFSPDEEVEKATRKTSFSMAGGVYREFNWL